MRKSYLWKWWDQKESRIYKISKNNYKNAINIKVFKISAINYFFPKKKKLVLSLFHSLICLAESEFVLQFWQTLLHLSRVLWRNWKLLWEYKSYIRHDLHLDCFIIIPLLKTNLEHQVIYKYTYFFSKIVNSYDSQS